MDNDEFELRRDALEAMRDMVDGEAQGLYGAAFERRNDAGVTDPSYRAHRRAAADLDRVVAFIERQLAELRSSHSAGTTGGE